MTAHKRKGILSGIKVIDLTRMLSGPYCTMILADHGAEVIKVETASGDTSRHNGPFRKDDLEKKWAGYFVSLNRNKKSIVLDLKSDAGRESFYRLTETADLVVENFRPGVMERLGIQYEVLQKKNPKLVYGAIRGFGDTRTGKSPYENWPSYDVVAQAMGGLVGLTGHSIKDPVKVGPGIGDIFTGVLMSFGLIAALRHSEATGVGQFVDVAMYDAIISLCERAIYQYDFEGTVPEPAGNKHPFLAPFGIFPAKDGNVAIGVVEDAFWKKLALAIGEKKYVDDSRFSTIAKRQRNLKKVNSLVSLWTKNYTRTELAQKLGGIVPFGPVNDVLDIINDDHVKTRNMIAAIPNFDKSLKPWLVASNPIKFDEAPAPTFQRPPLLGEHNLKYLNETYDYTKRNFSKEELRNALGTFTTGVTIITTRQRDGIPRGFTANSFTSVSMDPPLILVCIGKKAQSYSTFINCDNFGVNILGSDQKLVAGIFASQSERKFRDVGWKEGKDKVPLIEDSLASFICRKEKLVDAGDHTILIGRVNDFSVSDVEPLGYFRGKYFSKNLERSLAKAVSDIDRTTIGILLQNNRKVFFELINKDELSLPKIVAKKNSVELLIKKIEKDRSLIRLDGLFSVYWDNPTNGYKIFYRGGFLKGWQVKNVRKENYALYGVDKMPWNLIKDPAEKEMLKRYFEEEENNAFGIYEGDQNDGIIKKVID